MNVIYSEERLRMADWEHVYREVWKDPFTADYCISGRTV